MEVTSPPYPRDNASVPQLLRHLRELREWTVSMMPWADEIMLAYNAPAIFDVDDLPEIPELTSPTDTGAYAYVSVECVYTTHQLMQKLRKDWNDTLDNYEDDWDCAKCVKERLQAVSFACYILRNALLSTEQREARDTDKLKKVQKMYFAALKRMGFPAKLIKQMRSLHGSQSGTTGPDGEPIDFDALFNGTTQEQEDDED